MAKLNDHTKRSLSFGLNSAFITILVLCIVGVLNFVSNRYPQKIDLTKNKVHSLSDQSRKLIKELKGDIQFSFYGDFGGKEKYKSILENYQDLNPKVKLEWVNPNKEPVRTKQAGIRKADTLVITYEGKTSKVEDVTEEKVTNELIKLTSKGKTIVCSIIGHGEHTLDDTQAEGLNGLKKAVEGQAYETKEVTLVQTGKIPLECSMVFLMGPTRALFAPEVKVLGEYLNNGGRFVVGVDAQVTQGDQTQEIAKLLAEWGLNLKNAMIIDPISQVASLAVIPLFSKDLEITRDFGQPPALFPMARPIELATPMLEGIKTGWLAKSHAQTWEETDFAGLKKGQVSEAGKKKQSSIVAAYAQGKKKGSTAKAETRIVAFGSGSFANNQFSRAGANLDFVLNAISWVAEDESVISIRAKEEVESKLEIDANQEWVIRLGTIVIIPLLLAISGILVWIRRRKL